MAEQRKDSRNRILKDGESQLKNGTYRYRYTDATGVRHDVYSNRLLPTDRTPVGKREDLSLREKEERVAADLHDGIKSIAENKATLNELFEKYMAGKRKLKASTRVNYLYMYNTYVANSLGKRRIASIKYSDVKAFYAGLILDKGFKPNSMEILHTILHPTFDLAVRDEYIRHNPTTDAMREIKREYDWEKPKRHALSCAEQRAFVDFVKGSPIYSHWLPMFTIFLGTGCRVGELLGLCWTDCNFEKEQISINHNLLYRPSVDGKCTFHITTPKTQAGVRTIPILKDVRNALLELREQQSLYGKSTVSIDGYTDFVFVNRFGSLYTLKTVNSAIKRILEYI